MADECAMRTITFIVFSSLVITQALYSPSDDVIDLNPTNFHDRVVKSNELWLVEFYAPWCGHCQALTPEWKRVATVLKGIVKVGAVNADEHQSLGGQFGVRGFPTIKIFGSDKNKPKDYQGERNANAITETAMSHLQSLVRDRLSGKSGSGGSRGGYQRKTGDSKDVIELTDSNFEETVMKSKDMWLVEFYAPWCGHCKNLAPQWASAATELKGKVKLGALDATVHTVIANKYQIKGFPTIKFFPLGAKDGNVEDYDGGRTSSDIVVWAEEKLAENTPPPDAFEIVNENVLKVACEGRQLCIISILPVIYDCQAKCRNDYISLIKQMGEKYKKRMWGWVWAEAAAQQDLEKALGIGGFGYPAMAALNHRSMKYSLLKGPFSEKGLLEFFRELLYGKSSTVPLTDPKLPSIKNISTWDGKDKELVVEDDIDVSDVQLEDLKDEL